MTCGLLNYFAYNLNKTQYKQEIKQIKQWVEYLNNKALNHINKMQMFQEVIIESETYHLESLDLLIDKGVSFIVITRVKNDLDFSLKKKLSTLDCPPQQVKIIKKYIESHLAKHASNDLQASWKMLKQDIEKAKDIQSVQDIKRLLSSR